MFWEKSRSILLCLSFSKLTTLNNQRSFQRNAHGNKGSTIRNYFDSLYKSVQEIHEEWFSVRASLISFCRLCRAETSFAANIWLMIIDFCWREHFEIALIFVSPQLLNIWIVILKGTSIVCCYLSIQIENRNGVAISKKLVKNYGRIPRCAWRSGLLSSQK